LWQRTTHVLTEARASRLTSVEARRRRRSSPVGQDLMQRSEHARLLARLESMPVIEQAKGIIMAQSHCGEAQAFDLLRRASQRSNLPVRELAAQIVAKTTQVPPRRARRISRDDKVALTARTDWAFAPATNIRDRRFASGVPAGRIHCTLVEHG
jgi:hypothetical protein